LKDEGHSFCQDIPCLLPKWYCSKIT